MRRILILSGLLLGLAVSAAFAGGLNLRWTQCEGDAGTVQNLNFACNTNASFHALACSFTLDTDMLSVLSDELVVEIRTASPTLPAWWEIRGPAAE